VANDQVGGIAIIVDALAQQFYQVGGIAIIVDALAQQFDQVGGIAIIVDAELITTNITAIAGYYHRQRSV